MRTAQLIIFSHLSDAQIETEMGNMPNTVKHRLNFCKFIMSHVDGDLNKDIDPDALWTEYLETSVAQHIGDLD